MAKSNLQKVEQQLNELHYLVHSKGNMQITNRLSLSQERLLQENIALENEVKKLKKQLEYERLSNARSSNTVKTLENGRDSLVTAITLLNDDQTRRTPTNAASPQVDKSSPLHRDDNTGWLTVGERRVEAKSTIILGDSTIKYVDTRRMKSKGKNRSALRTFVGVASFSAFLKFTG